MDCDQPSKQGTCVVKKGKISSPLIVSAVVVTAWDPVTKVGGMTQLNTPLLPGFLLEDSSSSSDPVKELILEMALAGASTSRLQISLIGGAAPLSKTSGLDERFQIGARIISQVQTVLTEFGLTPVFQEVGGCIGRQCTLDVETGHVRVLSQNQSEVFLVSTSSRIPGQKE